VKFRIVITFMEPFFASFLSSCLFISFFFAYLLYFLIHLANDSSNDDIVAVSSEAIKVETNWEMSQKEKATKRGLKCLII
jgi:hypothetical protein